MVAGHSRFVARPSHEAAAGGEGGIEGGKAEAAVRMAALMNL